VNYSVDPYEVAREADALLVLTEWEQFPRMDWKLIREEMARSLVVGSRNMLHPPEMKALGFEYMSFGRPEKTVANPPRESKHEEVHGIQEFAILEHHLKRKNHEVRKRNRTTVQFFSSFSDCSDSKNRLSLHSTRDVNLTPLLSML
jgi:UDP-glucose/GDP-mannose dehydrogenase family, UDP binding domain